VADGIVADHSAGQTAGNGLCRPPLGYPAAKTAPPKSRTPTFLSQPLPAGFIFYPTYSSQPLRIGQATFTQRAAWTDVATKKRVSLFSLNLSSSICPPGRRHTAHNALVINRL